MLLAGASWDLLAYTKLVQSLHKAYAKLRQSLCEAYTTLTQSFRKVYTQIMQSLYKDYTKLVQSLYKTFAKFVQSLYNAHTTHIQSLHKAYTTHIIQICLQSSVLLALAKVMNSDYQNLWFVFWMPGGPPGTSWLTQSLHEAYTKLIRSIYKA